MIILGEVSERGARKRVRVSKKGVHAGGREVYVERGGAGGRALDYWLQAAVELERFLRPQQHGRRKNRRRSVRPPRER
jgi:hypothetical protein